MGLTACSNCVSLHDEELVRHGDSAFPLACYEDDMDRMDVAWHWHDEWEFIIITRGRAEFLLENRRLCLAEGDGVFINAKALHAVPDVSNRGVMLHSLVFHPRLIGGNPDSVFWQGLVEPFLQNADIKYIAFHADVPWEKTVLENFHTAWRAMADEPEDYINEIRYHISKATGIMTRHLDLCAGQRSAQERIDAERIRTMLEYIEVHYAEDISVQELAGCVDVSMSVCLRCFKQMLGTSPIQYLKKLRLQKAAAMLTASQKSVSQVATESGFSDISYFIKSFRQQYGCTPKVYRISS